MATDLLLLLLKTTLAGAAAIVLVLALRRVVRARFGSGVAYALWWLLPVAMLAASLPPRTAQVPMVAIGMVQGLPQAVASARTTVVGLDEMLLWTWIAGVAAMLLLLAWQQWRFHRRLGRVERMGAGLCRAQAIAGLPAVTGALQPRIVLPADFESRYSDAEQRLVLQHERIHLRRGDLQANAVFALLRCLHWFNPLVHVAAERFRRDQELACDESVVRRHPHGRRAYGDAMLKTQLAGSALPFGCQWYGQHPLKERIAMLKRPIPSRRQYYSGALTCALLAIATGFSAWAAQPAKLTDKNGAANEMPVVVERTPAPEYPEAAVNNKQSGKVLLKILVAKDGTVKQVKVEKSEPEGVFDTAAVDAAKLWKFKPAIADGKPVESWIRVPITFEWRPKEEPGQAPAAFKNGDHQADAYDWFRADKLPDGVRITCDIVNADPDTGVSYCGRLKKPAVEG